MKINTGDTIYEPMSRNTGEVISVSEHPNGKILKIRWRLDGQLPHDTELFYKKVKRYYQNEVDLTGEDPERDYALVMECVRQDLVEVA